MVAVNFLIAVLLTLFSKLDSCLVTITLTAPIGTVSSSDSVSLYSSDGGMDHCWLIRINASLVIKFQKFDLAKSGGKVQIYEKTKLPNDGDERFRLTSNDSTTSEFWLHGYVLLRLSTARSIAKDAFSFSYHEQNLFTLPGTTDLTPAAEIITDVKGHRSSHPNFGTSVYTDNLVRAWSIKAGGNRLINLRFNRIRTEKNYDTLTVLSGVIPNLNEIHHWNLSGDLEKIEKHFYGSVTLVFRSDTSTGSDGFDFEFNVTGFDLLEFKLNPVFSNWSGRIFNNSSFNLRVLQSDSSTTAQCTLKQACGNTSIDILLISDNGYALSRKFRLSDEQSSWQSPCLEEITCAVASSSGILIKKMAAPDPFPNTAQIEFINQGLLSLTGLIQFSVKSDSVCPTVRHRCELKAPDGSSVSAQLMHKSVSPPSPAECLSSVMSQFAVSSPSMLSADSVISCRLSNGRLWEQRLPLLNSKSRLASWWERPLLIAASVTAVLMGLTCIVFYLMRNRLGELKRKATGRGNVRFEQRKTNNRFNDCYDGRQNEGEVYVVPEE